MDSFIRVEFSTVFLARIFYVFLCAEFYAETPIAVVYLPSK